MALLVILSSRIRSPRATGTSTHICSQCLLEQSCLTLE